jgi:predicted outer membrane protein
MKYRTIQWFTIATASIAMACSSNYPPATTTTTSSTVAATTTTSSGDVMLDEPTGMWLDTVGGTWMDTTGALYRGGRTGTLIGLAPADVSTLTNAHVLAHIDTGDSLEVALSQLGVDRAQNSAVQNFARRMVTEHSAHMQTVMQTASQAGITPIPSPRDTSEATTTARMISRLSSTPAGTTFDRRFMRDEVIMHQHLLHDLTMARSQTSGPALQVVDQTIPVVRQHLADAETVWHQIGGGTNAHHRTK